MGDDIEERLAKAAEALREHEVTNQRCADLRARCQELDTELDELRARHADEVKDVELLERLSLTRVLVSLRGNRNDALARERAEADAARYRVAEAQARRDAVQREYLAAQHRRSTLVGAPETYREALNDKELHLSGSDDQVGRQLLEIADERGRLHAEMREMAEALQAAGNARHALAEVQKQLGKASDWSTYDTFFGGGALSSVMKHDRLDDAAKAAAHADRCLAVLRTELADVPDLPVTAPELAVDGLTRFVDVWFDNIFTDLAVGDRIKKAKRSVARCLQLVDEVENRLRQRSARAGTALTGLEQRRRGLLTH